MIKRLRPMLILAGVAVGLGLLLWVLVAFVLPKEPAGEEKANEVVLLNADLTEADRIEIKNTFDEYVLVKRAIENYYIEGKEDYPLIYDNVEYLLDNISQLKATKMLVDQPTDEQMEGYGLKEPQGVVTIVNDSDRYVLKLGTTSASGNYYCQLEGDEAVYLLSTTVPNVVLLSRYQFYSGRMIDYEDDATKNEDLTDIYIGGTGRDPAIRMKQQVLGEDEVGAAYLLTEPFNHAASSLAISYMSSMMTAMSSAPIVGDDTSPAGLAKYGLDKPVYTYRYVKGGKTFTVHLGNTNESGYQYCYEESGKFIYYIEASSAEVLGGNIKSFCENLIYSRTIFNYSALKIEGGGKTYNITVGDQDELGDFNVVINNKKVNSDLFSDFTSHLTTISITDIGEKKGNDCICTVTITLRDGSVDVLKFYPVSELKCFYELNGSGQFWVSKMNVEKIIENAQKLYDGEVINLEW